MNRDKVGGERNDPDFIFRGGYAFPGWANGSQIRTPDEAPYGYSFYVLSGPTKVFDGDDIAGMYSDRMAEWDRETYAAACQELDGNRFANAPLSRLSKFLSRYLGKNAECLQVLQGCNVSNGYPLWYFVYRLSARDSGSEAKPENAERSGAVEPAGSQNGTEPKAEGIAPTSPPPSDSKGVGR